MTLRKVGIGLALALFATAATLTVVEFVTRSQTADERGADFLVPPPDGIGVPYVLKPNESTRFEGHFVKIPATTVTISNQGIRATREFGKKQRNKRRIIALGDSFVFGSGVELEQTFVKQLEQQSPHFEVINLGVPGYTSTHAVEWFVHKGLALEPDGVVLFISDNDFYADGAKRLDERKKAGTSWATERYIRHQMRKNEKVSASWKHQKKAVLAQIQAALKRLAAVCAKHNIEFRVFMLFPHELSQEIKSSGVAIEQLADAAYLKEVNTLQIPRDLHPNAEGHRRLGILLTDALKTWLPLAVPSTPPQPRQK